MAGRSRQLGSIPERQTRQPKEKNGTQAIFPAQHASRYARYARADEPDAAFRRRASVGGDDFLSLRVPGRSVWLDYTLDRVVVLVGRWY